MSLLTLSGNISPETPGKLDKVDPQNPWKLSESHPSFPGANNAWGPGEFFHLWGLGFSDEHS